MPWAPAGRRRRPDPGSAVEAEQPRPADRPAAARPGAGTQPRLGLRGSSEARACGRLRGSC